MTQPPGDHDPYGQQPDPYTQYTQPYAEQPPGDGPPPYGQQPVGPGGQPPRKGFFGSLFDFSFEHFVTPMLVKAVYIVAIVALGLGWLIWVAAGFSQSAGFGAAVLLLGPILIFLYLCLIRMTLEFYLAITRMSQDIHHRLR
jgi:hypothetical protein